MLNNKYLLFCALVACLSMGTLTGMWMTAGYVLATLIVLPLIVIVIKYAITFVLNVIGMFN